MDWISSENSGRFEVAKIIARVFPKYKAFVQQVVELFDFLESEITYGPYATDKLIYRGERIVEYRTPPNTKGLGTMSGRLGENTDWIEGVAILEGETPDLLLLSVRLPVEMKVFTPEIIRQLELEASQDPRNRKRLGKVGDEWNTVTLEMTVNGGTGIFSHVAQPVQDPHLLRFPCMANDTLTGTGTLPG